MKKRLRAFLALIIVTMALFGLAACAEEGTVASAPAESVSSSETVEEETTAEQADSLLPETPPADESGSEVASEAQEPQAEALLERDGTYTTKEDVSLYLYTYGELPSNFITKKEAQALGWSGGSLEPYAPGKCIGGDRFGNYEGLLPEDRTYHECDINTLGAKSRGAERLVFSDDGLIYYTADHYETFTLLYGEE